jgi:hypothetical protein
VQTWDKAMRKFKNRPRPAIELISAGQATMRWYPLSPLRDSHLPAQKVERA